LCHGFFTTLICFFIPFKSLRNRSTLQVLIKILFEKE
jgi:hypothetical protein